MVVTNHVNSLVNSCVVPTAKKGVNIIGVFTTWAETCRLLQVETPVLLQDVFSSLENDSCLFFRVNVSPRPPSGGLALFKNILLRLQSKLMSAVFFFCISANRSPPYSARVQFKTTNTWSLCSHSHAVTRSEGSW